MSDELLQILMIFSIASVVAVLGSIVSALIYPLFRRAMAGCLPASRSLAIVCYGLVSPAVAVTVVALVMHPEFSQLLIPGHCHAGACGSHVPVIHLSSIGGVGLVVGSPLVLIVALLAGMYGLRMAHRRLGTLLGVARQDGERGFLIVESAELFAWCCGVWHAKILVSSGLVRQLTAGQLQMVLAHERAHERRMDNLRTLALRWLTVCWPSRSRNRIRADLASDIEKACDLDVTSQFGSRDSYIAILESMLSSRPQVTAGGRGTAFACRETSERITELANNPGHYRAATALVLVLFGLLSAQVMVVTGLTHFFVEWLTTVGL